MEYAFKVYTIGFICLCRQIVFSYRYSSGPVADGSLSPTLCLTYLLVMASLQLLHYCYMLILDPAGLETTSMVSSVHV